MLKEAKFYDACAALNCFHPVIPWGGASDGRSFLKYKVDTTNVCVLFSAVSPPCLTREELELLDPFPKSLQELYN